MTIFARNFDPALMAGAQIETDSVHDDIQLTTGHILVGNSNNLAQDVAMSGDATISSSGVVTIAGATGAKTLVDSNGVTAVDVGTTASAVNHVRVTDAATGNGPLISAVGTDTDIALLIEPKGAGSIVVGSAAGTGAISIGSSSAAQTVRLASGLGAPTVTIANASTAGATITVAGAATGGGATDALNLLTGNAVALGKKAINILTGSPATNGNNQLTVGGGTSGTIAAFNSTVVQFQASNLITGSAVANAPVATLNDAGGNPVTVAAGLRVLMVLSSTLQAGANTFNLNGHGADSIKSHNNPANDIGTAYVSGSVVDLVFDGTVWQDLSQ